MTERVDFYVLKSAAARQRWAFACRLTEKAYLKDLKIVIVSDTLADAQALDELLWTFNERSFIPHKVCLDEQSVDPATAVHLTVETRDTRGATTGQFDAAAAAAISTLHAASPKSSMQTRSAGARGASASRRIAISSCPWRRTRLMKLQMFERAKHHG